MDFGRGFDSRRLHHTDIADGPLITVALKLAHCFDTLREASAPGRDYR
jgi:hypothetical protein